MQLGVTDRSGLPHPSGTLPAWTSLSTRSLKVSVKLSVKVSNGPFSLLQVRELLALHWNSVRRGSYVSRAMGASGDCGPSAGVLATGPVKTILHLERASPRPLFVSRL